LLSIGVFYLYFNKIDLLEQACGAFAHLDAHPMYGEALQYGSYDFISQRLDEIVFMDIRCLLHNRQNPGIIHGFIQRVRGGCRFEISPDDQIGSALLSGSLLFRSGANSREYLHARQGDLILPANQFASPLY
jgi:hypothetical protein